MGVLGRYELKISELSQDRRNANKGTKRGHKAVEDSLSLYGSGRSILIDRNGRRARLCLPVGSGADFDYLQGWQLIDRRLGDLRELGHPPRRDQELPRQVRFIDDDGCIECQQTRLPRRSRA